MSPIISIITCLITQFGTCNLTIHFVKLGDVDLSQYSISISTKKSRLAQDQAQYIKAGRKLDLIISAARSEFPGYAIAVVGYSGDSRLLTYHTRVLITRKYCLNIPDSSGIMCEYIAAILWKEMDGGGYWDIAGCCFLQYKFAMELYQNVPNIEYVILRSANRDDFHSEEYPAIITSRLYWREQRPHYRSSVCQTFKLPR